MARACNCMSRFVHQCQISAFPRKFKSIPISRLPSSTSKIRASSQKEDSLKLKKNARRRHRAPRPLITISGSDAGWQGQWTEEYVVSLRELRLADLAGDGGEDAEVFIRLSVQKHISYGFSVDGRIITSFTSECSNCSSLFCREINTTFKAWVLPERRAKHENEMPEIGGDDPSVIYVRPGGEADLDSVIQETIQLAASLEDTCSDTCEESPFTWIGTSTIENWTTTLHLASSSQISSDSQSPEDLYAVFARHHTHIARCEQDCCSKCKGIRS